MIRLQSRWLIDRFHSCGQRLCKFLEQKKFFTLEKSSIQRGFLLYMATWPPFHCFVHQYGRRDVMWKRSTGVACGKNELRKRIKYWLSQKRLHWNATMRLTACHMIKKGVHLLAMFVAQKENYEKSSWVTLPGYDLNKGMKQQQKTAFSSKPFSLS